MMDHSDNEPRYPLAVFVILMVVLVSGLWGGIYASMKAFGLL
jgi:uncharacterized protein YneF (UPF0154 family)